MGELKKESEHIAADWPQNGLESVASCPVCGGSKRAVIHEGLFDNTFGVAPGRWTLWGCCDCGSGFLDPRPTESTISVAYRSYYTHQLPPARDKYEALSTARKVRRRLVNGYTNWRFGTKSVPASWLGLVAVKLAPSLRCLVDRQYRHIPRPPNGGGALLDIGFGNAGFLRLARRCGWDVVGIDTDSKAVGAARKDGLEVFEGGVENLLGRDTQFDVITLNHVIEHVHDPARVLRSCYELLKPGGEIWIETPNVKSIGHWWFGKSWRGLEAPRHLVLFDHSSITAALVDARFADVEGLNRRSACHGIFRQSFDIERGRLPMLGTETYPMTLRMATALAGLVEWLLPHKREFITIKARKVPSK